MEQTHTTGARGKHCLRGGYPFASSRLRPRWFACASSADSTCRGGADQRAGRGADQRPRDRADDSTRGSQAYDREWDVGQAMGWEEAVAFALGVRKAER